MSVAPWCACGKPSKISMAEFERVRARNFCAFQCRWKRDLQQHRVAQPRGDVSLPSADFAPMKQVDVFNFTTAEDVNRFQITTDRVIGGRTACAFSLKPYKSFTAGCFEGVIDFESSDPTSKGGFASFRTKPDERTRDLDAFGGVEMRVKTDGRS